MAYDDRPSELDHRLMLLERQLRQPGSRRRSAATIREINLLLLPPPSPLEGMMRPVPATPTTGVMDVVARSPLLPEWMRDAIEAKGFRPRALERALRTGKLVFTSLELDEQEEHAKKQGWDRPRLPANLAEAGDARFYGIRIEF